MLYEVITLVNIDDTELISSIESLKMTLNLQQEDLTVNNSIHQRNKKLYEVGGLAKEQFDLSAVGLQNKKILVSNTIEKIKQLEHQLTYMHIKAPFDGEKGKAIGLRATANRVTSMIGPFLLGGLAGVIGLVITSYSIHYTKLYDTVA